MKRIARASGVVVLVVVSVLMAGVAVAQVPEPVAPKDLVGVWNGTAQTPNGEVTLKVAFTLKDGTLAATVESSMGPMPVTAITLVDDRLGMDIVVMETQASLAAKVQGTRMDGTWTLGADSGPFTLTKAGDTAQAEKK